MSRRLLRFTRHCELSSSYEVDEEVNRKTGNSVCVYVCVVYVCVGRRRHHVGRLERPYLFLNAKGSDTSGWVQILVAPLTFTTAVLGG